MQAVGVSTGQPQTDAAKLEGWINDVWTRLRQAYLSYHQNIWEAFLFKVGQMWIEWDPQRKLYTPTIPADDWVPQPRLNKFSPAINSIASNFNEIPQIEAIARESAGNEGDVERFGIAEMANLLAAHFMSINGLKGDYKGQEDKIGVAAQLFALTGCFFPYVYRHRTGTRRVPRQQSADISTMQCLQCDSFHKLPGIRYPIAPQGCPNCGVTGEKVLMHSAKELQPVIDEATGEPIIDETPEYEIRCRIGNPLFFYPRPGATNMSDTPYMIWAERFPLDEIVELWNYKAAADNEQPDSFNTTLENALNYYYLGFQGGHAQSRDAALVLQIFIPPGKTQEFPGGIYGVYINGKVIHAERWNFPEHPLTKADYESIPTLFFPFTPAFDLVQVQRELKDFWSIVKLHAMTSAVEPIVVDENTQVSEITGRADKIVTWRSIGPGSREPHRMQHGQLDGSIYRSIEKLESYFDAISMAVSVFRGEQPGSITAGNAIAELRGQAEQMFSRPVQNWNSAWRETVRKGVKFIQQTYSLPAIAALVGGDRLKQIQDFLNANLDTAIEFVSTSHGLPRTRDEKRQEMMAMFDRGALDIKDVNVRQKIFELFGETGMMQQFNADATRARKENRDMRKGTPPNFMPEIEDLAIHFSVHAQAIKSLDFESWQPEARQLLMQHALETKQALRQSAAPTPPVPPVKH